MELDQVHTDGASTLDDNLESVVSVHTSTPQFSGGALVNLSDDKNSLLDRNQWELSKGKGDLAPNHIGHAQDQSQQGSSNKKYENVIPVPQRTSSKLLNLPNVVQKQTDRVYGEKSNDGNSTTINMGWSLGGAESRLNETVATKSIPESKSKNNSMKMNDSIGWTVGALGLRPNETVVRETISDAKSNSNYSVKINDDIGWKFGAAGSSHNCPTDWVSPDIHLKENNVLKPEEDVPTTDLNWAHRHISKQKENDSGNQPMSWTEPATTSGSTFTSRQPTVRVEALINLKNPVKSTAFFKTSEATGQSTLYSDPSNAASKMKLDSLLESVGDRVSTAVGLAQFPLDLSTESMTGRIDQVDGASCSKAVRNRAKERMNDGLLSAVFCSKPAEEILKLLDKGAEIHTKCRDSGASLLHVAALNADAGTVELLISKGCDVKARDRGGRQPVHVAAWEGALNVLQVLCENDDGMVKSRVEPEVSYINHYPDSWNHKHEQLNKYWNVMDVITTGSTPLHIACRRTKESCVKFLIDAGAEPVEDSKGLYPVDVIGIDVGEDPTNRETSNSWEGSLVGIAKLLISHHKRSDFSTSTKKEGQQRSWTRVRRLFSVEDHDKRPVTALHTAVSDNNLNLITILLDEEADVLMWNEGGATPLHLAVKKKFLDALCLMLQHGDNRERRVVNAVDMRNRTLLHLAVDEEWADGINILLEENADITCKNDRRETVLHLAAASGNLKILTELLTVPNVSAIVNAVDDDCYAPIHYAVEKNHKKCIELLINNGAKANIILPDGQTLLHICAKNNAEDLLKYLMDSTQVTKLKENKTSFGEGGMTALHVAASLGHSSIVKVLLDYGCDLGAKTEGGTCSTPLHLAAKFDRTEVLRTILEHNRMATAMEAKDAHGWYPLHIAAGHGHEESVDILLRAGSDIALTVEDEQGSKFTGLDIIMTCVHRPVDFLVKILDSYIIVDSKVPVTNPQCKIEVDFDFLLPSPSERSELHAEGLQLKVLEAVLNNGSDDLEEAFFLHPIVQTFLYLKSKNMFLFFALFFDLFFLLALYLSAMAYHGVVTLQQPLYRYILIGLLSINMLFEIINIVRLKRYYRKDPETWIKWIVYANILVIVIHPIEFVLRYNMAVSILLSWTELLLIIAKYPVWGIYVLMFATVAGTILKVLVVFSLMLVGFAFTFRALFQEKGPFNTVWSSIVKVIIMVYELDFRGTMEEIGDEGPLFADIARFFYLLFVVMVSMSLVNLMLGLAVSDIADLKRKGRAKRLAKQVAFLGGLENLLYCWPFSLLPMMRRYRQAPRCLVVKAGTKLSGTEDSPVPKKIKESIIDKARSVQQTNQRTICSPVQLPDAKLKEDTSSVATRKSLSASHNKTYLQR